MEYKTILLNKPSSVQSIATNQPILSSPRQIKCLHTCMAFVVYGLKITLPSSVTQDLIKVTRTISNAC